MLIRIGGSAQQKTRTVNLISYSVLMQYTLSFMETGQSISGFYRTYKAKCQLVFGTKEEDIIDRKAWMRAVNIFWIDILQMNMKESYSCKSCGDFPSVLVFDGIAMGLQVKKVVDFREKMKKFLARKSRNNLKGSKFSERVYIRKPKNRAILLDASVKNIWPIPSTESISTGDSDDQDKNAEDPGMVQFWTLLQQIDKTEPPGEGMVQMMLNLSAKTSTTSLFQIIDIPLMEKLVSFLEGDANFDFIQCSTESQIQLSAEMMKKYPTITNMLRNLAKPTGSLNNSVALFLVSIIRHSINVYLSSDKRINDDYISEQNEVASEVFPNFPQFNKRAEYEKNCTNEDKQSFKGICNKTYGKHKNSALVFSS